MHTVHYTKHFLTGNLAGLAVPCHVSHGDAEHALRFLEAIQRYTPERPGSDCVTGALYYVKL